MFVRVRAKAACGVSRQTFRPDPFLAWLRFSSHLRCYCATWRMTAAERSIDTIVYTLTPAPPEKREAVPIGADTRPY